MGTNAVLAERVTGIPPEKQLLTLFMAQLPDMQKDINRYTEAGNLFRLERELYRLLGSCMYCNVPTLQAVLEDFTQVVRCMGETDHALLKIYLDEFNEQVAAIVTAYQE